MEQSRTKNVIRNLLSAFLTGIVGTILPFFVRTYTIKYLGSEYMGLNNLCSSILYVLSASDLGVANAFAFRLYKPISEKNTMEVCRLLGFYKKVYLVIGGGILGVGIIILPFFKYFISQNTPNGVNVYWVFFSYLINTVISYTVFAYKNLIFSADQRKDYESMTTTITFGVLYLGQIILIRNHQYYLSVLLLPVCTLFCNIFRNWIATHKYPEYVPIGSISRSEALILKKDIFSVAIYKFRDISRNAFDNIVISAFAGLIVLSNYQNYYMVLTVPVWILSIVYMSILPSVGNFAVSNSPEEMYGIYKKNTFILSFLSTWFAICFCFLIQDFITIWLGADFRLSWASAVLFSVYIYLHGEAMNIKIMRESIGLWNHGRIWAGIEMLANILLNVLLIIWLGIEGIILATILSILLISIPVENRIIFSQYLIGKGMDKVKHMAINVIWMVCTAIAVGILCHIAPQIQYVSFTYKVFVCTLVPPLSCILCFRCTEEFQFIKDIILRLIRKH